MRLRLLQLTLFGILMGCDPAGFVAGSVDVNEGMNSDDPIQREAAMMQGQVLLTLGLGTCGAFVLVIGFRHFRNRSGSAGASITDLGREQRQAISNSGRLGVLTVQFVVGGEARSLISSQTPPSGDGPEHVARLVTQLREQRAQWLFVAARGTPPMDSGEAVAECERILSVFETRASSADYRGAAAALLTATVRAPFDFSQVMPGDISGFESALSRLFEIDSSDTCGYRLQWADVSSDGLHDVIPGLVSARVG